MFDHILLSAFSPRACRNDAMAHPATWWTRICYTRNPLHERVISTRLLWKIPRRTHYKEICLLHEPQVTHQFCRSRPDGSEHGLPTSGSR